MLVIYKFLGKVPQVVILYMTFHKDNDTTNPFLFDILL